MTAANSSPWHDLRAAMPVAERMAYFDHAAVAPLSGPARDVILAWCHDMATAGDLNWRQWNGRAQRARALGAKLIAADEGEVALVRNTTEGISLVAEGYPWQPGDNVVTLADEFPSNLFPWMNLARRSVETRPVEVVDGRVDLDRLADACDRRTRVVTVSWVGYASGYRLDVAEVAALAHARGALLFLDAIQGLGVFPLDVQAAGVDFLAADGHKWLLGPEGAGLFYVRREHLDRLVPLGVGWNSVRTAGDYGQTELALKSSAARYEGGSPNMSGNLALAASLELLARWPTAELSRRLLEMADELVGRLTEAGAIIHSDRTPAHASGIVSFELPGRDPHERRERCLAADVVLSVRDGRLRAAPHAYTNQADIDRLIAALTA